MFLHQNQVIPQAQPSVDTQPEPDTTQGKTHPVPYRIINALRDKEIIASEAAIMLILNYHARWDNDKGKGPITRYLTQSQIAAMMPKDTNGNTLTQCQVSRLLKSLTVKGFISIHKKNAGQGQRYKLNLEIMIDGEKQEFDKAIDKFMCPYGRYSPFQKVIDGEITFYALVDYVMLKSNSDFNTGKTHRVTNRSRAKRCRLGIKRIIDNTRQLQDADLLRRLSKPGLKGQYQLYPKPAPKHKPTTKTKTTQPKHKPPQSRHQSTVRTERKIKESTNREAFNFVDFYKKQLEEQPESQFFKEMLEKCQQDNATEAETETDEEIKANIEELRKKLEADKESTNRQLE